MRRERESSPGCAPQRASAASRISAGLCGIFSIHLLSCTSASIQSDVARVQELSAVRALPQVVDAPVARGPDPALTALLREPLDAERAVRVALLANRELRARLRELGIARGRILQAGLLPNPRAELELLPERASNAEVRVEYDLTRAVLAPLRARALGPELESERFRVAMAVVDLGFRARVGLLRVQASEQRLAIARQSLSGLQAAREAAHAMFEAGNVPALDLATQETAYEKGSVEVERLSLDNLRERERFSRLLGVPETAPTWRVKETLLAAPDRALTPDDLENRALRASLELRATRQHLEALARRAGFTDAEGWVPDITVDVHALNGSPEAGSSTHDWRFGGGVNVSVPLFDRQQGEVLALNTTLQAELERYYGRAGALRSEARELQQRITSAHARARHYQEVILPAQDRVTQQSLLQYNAMQLGVFQLLAARRDQLDAQLAYVDVLREYWSDVAELEALLQGRTITDEAASPAGAAVPPLGAARAPGEHG
jgi:outer membrane protein, heavy metal efflux system